MTDALLEKNTTVECSRFKGDLGVVDLMGKCLVQLLET